MTICRFVGHAARKFVTSSRSHWNSFFKGVCWPLKLVFKVPNFYPNFFTREGWDKCMVWSGLAIDKSITPQVCHWGISLVPLYVLLLGVRILYFFSQKKSHHQTTIYRVSLELTIGTACYFPHFTTRAQVSHKRQLLGLFLTKLPSVKCTVQLFQE